MPSALPADLTGVLKESDPTRALNTINTLLEA